METKDTIIISREKLVEHISENIGKVFEEMFSRSYSNPLKDAIENELKEKDGVLKKMVSDLVVEIMNDESMKNKVKDLVMTKLIEKAMKA